MTRTCITELRFHESRLVKRHLHQMKDQQEAFRKAEDRLKRVLSEQQGKLKYYLYRWVIGKVLF